MVRKGISNLAVVRHSAEKHDAFSEHVTHQTTDRQFEPSNILEYLTIERSNREIMVH